VRILLVTTVHRRKIIPVVTFDNNRVESFDELEKVDELHNKMFTQEEKDFIAQALTHMTSDDIHARVEDNARIARVKQQILDKL